MNTPTRGAYPRTMVSFDISPHLVKCAVGLSNNERRVAREFRRYTCSMASVRRARRVLESACHETIDLNCDEITVAWWSHWSDAKQVDLATCALLLSKTFGGAK